MRHSDVRLLLYDYLQAGLDPEVRKEIGHHLAHCESCTRDLRAVKAVLGALPAGADDAGVAMGDSDWNALRDSVMRRLQDAEKDRERFSLATIFPTFRVSRGHPRYAIAAGLAVIILGLLWFLRPPAPDRSPVPREAVRVAAPEPVELGRYFRKSRALLVGLSNIDPPADRPVDLSAEREISRQLMLEGRSLRGHKLDPRSDRLISDLDRIMERVSSTPEAIRPPDIQTIRNDIRGQNLLVKLRVAETSFSGNTVQGKGL